MFYVSNLETRSILTYKAGDRIMFVNPDVAIANAQRAQDMTNQPHAVIPVTELCDALHREIAPWLK